MREPQGRARVTAEAEVPIWSLNHFLEQLSSNYLKIVTLREICFHFASGANDSDFLIAARSFDLFPAGNAIEQDFGRLIVLASKETNAEEFWKTFRHLHRPIVLYKESPLFDPESGQALKLRNLSKNSPWDFDFEGKIAALIDLLRGRTMARRQNEDNSKALENVRNIVETSRLIEDDAIPWGVKRFAAQQLEAIMNKQHKVNQKLGIKPRHFEVPTHDE